MAMKEEPNTPVIFTIGAISVLLIVVVMFGVEAWFRSEAIAEMDTQWRDNPNTWLNDLREEQTKHITTVGFNKDEDAWHIGIEQAIREVVKDNGKLPALPAPTTAPTTAPATQPAAEH